jgi:hypothetical protein
MSEEAPHEFKAICEDLLKPEVTEFTASENVKVRIVNIGGKITSMGYKIENRKRP